jgi:hypothetical protein
LSKVLRGKARGYRSCLVPNLDEFETPRGPPAPGAGSTLGQLAPSDEGVTADGWKVLIVVIPIAIFTREPKRSVCELTSAGTTDNCVDASKSPRVLAARPGELLTKLEQSEDTRVVIFP